MSLDVLLLTQPMFKTSFYTAEVTLIGDIYQYFKYFSQTNPSSSLCVHLEPNLQVREVCASGEWRHLPFQIVERHSCIIFLLTCPANVDVETRKHMRGEKQRLHST